jgi:hypothetical protein
MRSHVWEIIRHHSDDKVRATLWWDGQKVRCDDQEFLELLKDGTTYGNDFKHSPEWLDTQLPRIFKSGYMMARKAKVKN